MGKIVKAIGSGVGLVAEAVTTARQPKQNKSSGALQVPNGDGSMQKMRSRSGSNGSAYSEASDMSDMSDSEGDETERAWALDEAEDEVSSNDLAPTMSNGLSPTASNGLSPTSSKDMPTRKMGWDTLPSLKSLEEMCLAYAGPPPPGVAEKRLELPVVLPQRRPQAMMGRGFVRAYAPILEQKAISEEAFMVFLKCFGQTNRTNPALGVIFASANIAGIVPGNIFISAGSFVLQTIVYAAIVQQKRSRARTFLDEMNETLFKPRGLYALIVAYNPNQERPIETGELDTNTMVAKRDGETARKFFPKVVAGQNFGEVELPESAPLIYPSLDELNAEKMNKMKKGKKWVSDYHDRRQQIEYIRRNPNSKYMDLPEEQQPTFANRLADPNHPAFQGSWLTLFSGGKIKPLKGTADQKAARKAAKRQAQGKKPGKKDMMKENVLYLMIVNMPTEEEMQGAMHAMEVTTKEMEQQKEIDAENMNMAQQAGGPPPGYKN